jgi:hypothetical protein
MFGDFYGTLLMDWIRFSFNSSFRASKTKGATSKAKGEGFFRSRRRGLRSLG